ncbi:hypothetical protein FQN54_005835 [Arachnomyces sp. PD_36]|nr:hypothetical protein FQN54_005835 [Arachnomyces sp. PD_36]
MAKNVIVSYPNSTPDSVVADAKKLVKDQGGHITHEYTIFKGFAAEVPDGALDTMRTQGGEHVPTIEDDNVISIAT